jgi:uncharacterized protein (DUF169 family)
MTDYALVSNMLTESLRLDVPPVAVCVTDKAPHGVPESKQAAAAGCVFWERGAHSAFVTSPKDHGNCAVGMYTHHMPLTAAQQTDLGDCLKVFGDLGYVRPEDEAAVPVLKEETKYVTYAPLAATPVRPSTVLIFANSRQSLAITEAVQQVDPSAPPALGRPACAVIPQVMNTGKPALSLGSCGARAYLNVMTDEFALWALPGLRIAEYAEGIKRLAEANRILTQFHKLRRRDVEAGGSPSVKESLVRLEQEG